MYAYMYIYIHVYTWHDIRTCIYTHMYVYIYIFRPTYLHIHACTYTCTRKTDRQTDRQKFLKGPTYDNVRIPSEEWVQWHRPSDIPSWRHRQPWQFDNGDACLPSRTWVLCTHPDMKSLPLAVDVQHVLTSICNYETIRVQQINTRSDTSQLQIFICANACVYTQTRTQANGQADKQTCMQALRVADTSTAVGMEPNIRW